MHHSKQAIWHIWLGVTLYLLLNTLLQLAVSSTADLDQAEQLLLSQQLKAGYNAQPPLYTWLVYLLFQLTGPQLLTLLVLKVCLLSLLVAGLLNIGRYLGFNQQQHLVTIAGLALIPQFLWESQRLSLIHI